MKHVNKLLSFVLVLALTCSLTSGFVSKAAGTITVTLRIEQDDSTLLKPVSVTLTEEDKNNDFGIGLSTGSDAAQSPLRAYAKYLSEKGVTNEDMGKYIIASPSDWGGLYVTGISATGDGIGDASTEGKSDVHWMYNVNNIAGAVSMSEYNLKDSDSVVIYGLWSPWPATEETLYTAFDSETYNTTTNSVTVTLTGYGTSYDDNGAAISFTNPVENATVLAVSENAETITGKTDANGKAVLSFPESDKEVSYVLTAYKTSSDGSHYTISRPYALVTVAAKDNSSITTTPSVKKPAKVKQVSAKVKKSNKAKKSVVISWKKVSGANGYQIYVSTKKKSGYKKVADVKKTSATIKKKKGIYYVKVRAFKKTEGKKLSGSFSSICKVNVK